MLKSRILMITKMKKEILTTINLSKLIDFEKTIVSTKIECEIIVSFTYFQKFSSNFVFFVFVVFRLILILILIVIALLIFAFSLFFFDLFDNDKMKMFDDTFDNIVIKFLTMIASFNFLNNNFDMFENDVLLKRFDEI